jgi:hypothetical protein
MKKKGIKNMSIKGNKGITEEAQKAAMPLPFEQQPRECLKAFTAFKTYLDLGPERSLAAVARKLGKGRRHLEVWSSQFDWPARVQAHAGHIAQVERLAIERLAVEKAVEWHKLHEAVRREAWKEAEATIALVRQARAEWAAQGKMPGWAAMTRLLELAFKLKQFAAGMPSEVKEVNTNLTATIDAEWEVAIRKAYGQAELGSALPAEPVAEAEPQPARGNIVDVQEVRPGLAKN